MLKLSNICENAILNTYLLSLLLQNARHMVLNHKPMYSYFGIGSIECALNMLIHWHKLTPLSET